MISRAVKSGYQELHPVEDLHVVEGRRVEGGGFAVIKDDTEDRPIAPLERLNASVDPEKIPRVEYGFIPQLATVTVNKTRGPRPTRVLVSERDARHYYPSLLAGSLLPPWFAGPPVFRD
eukprot:15543521-Heterocapsa_arctica.AAC.1